MVLDTARVGSNMVIWSSHSDHGDERNIFLFCGGGDDFDPYTHVGTWRRYFRRLPGKMSWHILMLSTCKVHESFKTTSVGFISTSQQSLECPGQLVGLTAWLPSPQDFHVRSSEKKLWRMSRMSTVHRFCLDLMILWLVCGLFFFHILGMSCHPNWLSLHHFSEG